MKQLLRMYGNPTAGTFTLTVEDATTGRIPFDASAEQLQLALREIRADACCYGGPLPDAAIGIHWTDENAKGCCITRDGNQLAGDPDVLAVILDV
jgi:hypothetical protein